MITVDELRYVLKVKEWNDAARKAFDSSWIAPMLQQRFQGIVDTHLFDTIDWFIALVARETGVEISASGVETIASLTRKRTLQKRNPGR